MYAFIALEAPILNFQASASLETVKSKLLKNALPKGTISKFACVLSTLDLYC